MSALTFLDLRTMEALEPTASTRTLLCLGNFDGVHRAHASLLQETRRLADDLSRKESGKEPIQPGVFLFAVPPADLLQASPPPHITDLRQKLMLFRQEGMALAVIADFTALRALPAERFTEEILKTSCRCVGTVCGYNFRFGAGAEGSAATLCAAFSHTRVLPRMTVEETTVSSSAIRHAVQIGDLARAEEMLGRPLSLYLRFENQKGIPTASVEKNRLMPPDGTYAASINGIRTRACLTRSAEAFTLALLSEMLPEGEVCFSFLSR